MSEDLRVALIASARYPIREPFAGGLEAHTWELARSLTATGVSVTVFAAEGSDPALGVEYLPVPALEFSDAARADVSMQPDVWMVEHHAYLGLMLDLMSDAGRFDLVHNNSLHYLPMAMADALPMPMVCTLHTPPTPWLESAIRHAEPHAAHFVAVSHSTAAGWSHLLAPDVIYNGIDLDRWKPGPGGGPLVWSGRIVPEKGPHLAASAARMAGMPLHIAGPVVDHGYFDERVRPLLDDEIRYLGHLSVDDLVGEVGRAAATVVTPCWAEPYGLVVAESLACGTPVAGFARGALPELVDETCARLAPPGAVPELARAITEAVRLDRSAARSKAAGWSRDRMVRDYLRLYAEVVA